jgi:hypothetical protein
MEIMHKAKNKYLFMIEWIKKMNEYQNRSAMGGRMGKLR